MTLKPLLFPQKQKLISPSVVKRSLKELKTKPKKGLSQNFLVDENILKKIISSARIGKDDYIIEIGPGIGTLTEALLKTGAHVLAIEKDPFFIEPLQKRFASPHFELIHADCLKVPFKEKIKKGVKAKVISNIPYHLTTPILHTLLPLESSIETITLMMQYEMAKRCTGKVGTKDYSSLSLFVQLHSHPTLLFSVKPTSFYPSPSVQSALISFALKPFPPSYSPDFVFKIIRMSFNQRRKMLRRSLDSLCSREIIEKSLEKLGLSPQARPEELSLNAFLNFTRELKNHIENPNRS